LWSRFGSSSALGATAPDQAQPAILRFDDDQFMEQVLAALEHDPASLGDRIARPETWRLPPGVEPDLIERVPLPKLAKSLARLLPPSEGAARVEYAFVKDASGARWQRVADGSAALVPGEEMLPLFSMGFTADNGQQRRLQAGTVPVGRREEYMSTRAQSALGG